MLAERGTAAGCRKLEHLDLEDMFGRRPRPLLRIHLELRQRPGGDPHEELHVAFTNEGRAIARYTGLLATLPDGETRVVGTRPRGGGLTDVTVMNNGVPSFQFIDNVGVIHPNGLASLVGHVILQRPRKGAPLRVNVKWYCDLMRWRSGELEVAPGAPVYA